MKLLLFSDLHKDKRAAEQLVQRSGDVDVAVGAGDFATVHSGLAGVIEVLARMSCPTVLVPGNSETFAALKSACDSWDSAHVLHGSGTSILGVDFFGLGGGIPVTPFGPWSYDFTESEAKNLLAECPDDCVLVTHSPPKGAADVSSSGTSLGSVTVRKTVEIKKPMLVVCGHIHESGGTHEFIGRSPVVNAGPGGIVWEIS